MTIRRIVPALIIVTVVFVGWVSSQRVAVGQAPGQPEVDKFALDQSPRTLAELDEMFDEVSNWGRWGEDDVKGAVNLITDAKRRQAAGVVQHGIAVSLARVVPANAEAGRRPNIRHTIGRPGGEFLVGSYQVPGHNDSMTHIDALCHIWYKGRMYKGFTAEQGHGEEGCLKNGLLGTLKNGLVTRGLLIDLPRLRGVPYLEPATPVYAEDIEAWEEETGLKVSSGDAIFIRTGRWVRAAQHPEDPDTMTQLTKVGSAGFHPAIAPWLKERGVAVAGQDGGAGRFPSPVPGLLAPFSVLAVGALGISLIVASDLEEAAATAERLNQWEFMLSLAPLQVEGGTGQAIHPIAVF